MSAGWFGLEGYFSLKIDIFLSISLSHPFDELLTPTPSKLGSVELVKFGLYLVLVSRSSEVYPSRQDADVCGLVWLSGVLRLTPTPHVDLSVKPSQSPIP